jgi:hypothetical protein
MYFSADVKGLDEAYVAALNEGRALAGGNWETAERPARWFAWLSFRNSLANLPAQGWKIHVSCAADEAHMMVHAILPRLIEEGVAAFKLPASLQGVLVLNSELAGRTQAGKVMTIYPRDSTQAGGVIRALQSLWTSDRGPCVLSDLPVSANAALFLRYGSFSSAAAAFDALGRPVNAIQDPAGHRLDDVRTVSGRQPLWAPPPPCATGDGPAYSSGAEFSIRGRRHVRVQRLNVGLRVQVELAVTVDDLRLVVTKRARRGVMGDLHGHDAISRLRNEYHMLRWVAPHGLAVAEALDFEEDEASCALVQTHIDGTPLTNLSRDMLFSRLGGLAASLRSLHQVGVVHRDIKLANAVDAGGVVHLVDFELAAHVGEPDAIPGGTPGHMGPEGAAAAPATSSDRFAYGAALFEGAIGVSAAALPVPNNRGRLIGCLQATGQPTLASLVKRLTSPQPAERPDLSEASEALELLEGWENQPTFHDVRPRSPRELRRLRRFACRSAVAAGFATRQYRVKQDGGYAWRNAHVHATHLCHGLNIGAAGVVLGLLSLDTALGMALFTRDVREGASWLARRGPDEEAHGLFSGNAGVALVLGVTGRRFGDGPLLAAAARALEAAANQSGDCDLFSGAAGVLWAGCLLSDVLEEDWPLRMVEAQARHLHSRAELVDGLCVWPASPLFDPEGRAYFGAAHGAAGSAMALAAWAVATGCEKSEQLAITVFDGLVDRALSTSFPTLPEGPGRPARAPEYWCHGTAGLLWCLLQATGLRNHLKRHVALCAAAVFDQAPFVSNPTLCHGTAGLLELSRMLDGAPGAPPHARALRARGIEALRLSFQRRGEDGIWSSEHPRDITPDLWVGFLGPAVALAQEAVDSRHALLSAPWLTRCAQSLGEGLE